MGNVYPVIERPNDTSNRSLKGRPQVVAAIFMMFALQHLSHVLLCEGPTLHVRIGAISLVGVMYALHASPSDME